MPTAATYHVGDRITATTTFTVDGTNTTPSTYSAQVKDPSGNESAVTPTVSATGVLVSNITVDEAGTWWYRIKATAGVIAADEQSFVVTASNFTTP